MTDTLRCIFRDGAFHPFRRHQRWCRENFEENEVVFAELQHQRNASSHKHQFAYINDAHGSLPERFHNLPFAASPTTLRKHALIKTGYCTISTLNAGSHANAGRVAEWVQSRARAAGEYIEVDIMGPSCVIKEAMSQKMSKMGKKDFEESKEAVLRYISELIGCDPEELRRQGQ